MTRMVHCVKLGREAPGMKFAPLPNALGKRIFENVSQEAWDAWTRHQTMLINENRLKTIFSATVPTKCRVMCRRNKYHMKTGRLKMFFRRPAFWPRLSKKTTILFIKNVSTHRTTHKAPPYVLP